ncbi:MAG: phytanoyl-CoA dioxygenase family protein [Chloroflexota bacterium]|nr:phytanoyl-CoA dioxygenase family protein [Chloroflexota bacterium]
MKTDLTQEQINFYQENGFIIIEDFLTLGELATWRQHVDDAVEKRADRRLADGPGWEDDDSEESRYYNRVFVQRLNLWTDHEGMRELMLDPRLGKLASELAGVDGMRIWHDQALIKLPWANPTGWHLDNPYWSYSSRDAISIWVALDDATRDNGCLYFLPGTHKTATFDNSGIGVNTGELLDVYPQWAEIQSVAAPMKAGSCSFHNGLLAHGAGANMTPGTRRAMTCGYMPDGCVFNGKPNILPQNYLDTLEIGDVLDDDSINPLIWHKTKSYLTA